MYTLKSICKRVFLILSIFFIHNSITAQCDAGILQTTGTVNILNQENFFVQATDLEIPSPDGNFGWIFSNRYSTGTGALGDYFIMTTNLTENNFDNNLNGFLSFNDYPKLNGTWVLYGAVVSDRYDALNTICDITSDSLVINFTRTEVNCTVGVIDNPREEDVCFDGNFTLSTQPFITSPSGGHGWLFSNQYTNGSGGYGEEFLINTTSFITVYDTDLNGLLSFNNQPYLKDTWVVKGVVFNSINDPYDSICEVSQDSIILNFTSEIIVEAEIVNGELVYTVEGGTPPYEPFSLLDLTVTPPIFYQAVRDVNGCTGRDVYPEDVFSTTNVEDIKSIDQFSIFPNPISDNRMNINLQLNANKNIQMELMSTNGQLIQTLVNENSRGNTYQFDIPDVATGLYFLKVNIEGQQFMEKVIIR